MAGRNSKYTPDKVKAITDALTLGVPYRYACAAAGISEDTFARWRQRYADFADAIKEAEARGIGARLQRIRKAEEDHWQASAWWLERRYPHDFGRTVQETKITGKIEHEIAERAERLASEFGLDPADVLAEAEAIVAVSGKAAD